MQGRSGSAAYSKLHGAGSARGAGDEEAPLSARLGEGRGRSTSAMEGSNQLLADIGQRAPRGHPVERVLTMLGYGRYQWVTFVSLGVSEMADGSEMLILAFVGASLQNEWSLTSTQRGLIASVVFAGCLIGSVLGGIVADAVGRRLPFLAAMAALAIFGVASAFAVDVASLVSLRFFVGVAIGAGVVIANALAGETTPKKLRGFFSVLFSLWLSMGELLIALLAW